MKDLHKLFRILRNCQCKWLLVSSRVPRTCASFSGFLVKFCFCTGTPGSIEQLDPAPRLRFDDCFETRNYRLGPCDLLLSIHYNNQLEVRPRLCVFCTGLLQCGSVYRSRNVGLQVNEHEHDVYPNLHVSWIKALKTLHEKNWRENLPVMEFHHPPNFLWVPTPGLGFKCISVHDFDDDREEALFLSRTTKKTKFHVAEFFFRAKEWKKKSVNWKVNNKMKRDGTLCVHRSRESFTTSWTRGRPLSTASRPAVQQRHAKSCCGTRKNGTPPSHPSGLGPALQHQRDFPGPCFG